MSEHVPSMNDLRLAWRKYRQDLFSEASDGELCRFFDAHDQGIRDAVKPPKMTAREHLKAAWKAACPVPASRKIPANTGYLSWRNGECVGVYPEGVSYETPGREGDLERRTLEPLPPVIPDDCNWVFASTPEYGGRLIWIRETDNPDCWRAADGTACIRTAYTNDLIDPKPVPEEER